MGGTRPTDSAVSRVLSLFLSHSPARLLVIAARSSESAVAQPWVGVSFSSISFFNSTRSISMAHLVQTMAYVGETPWHNLGQQLPAKQPIDVWAREAGMDWTIRETPVR